MLKGKRSSVRFLNYLLFLRSATKTSETILARNVGNKHFFVAYYRRKRNRWPGDFVTEEVTAWTTNKSADPENGRRLARCFSCILYFTENNTDIFRFSRYSFVLCSKSHKPRDSQYTARLHESLWSKDFIFVLRDTWKRRVRPGKDFTISPRYESFVGNDLLI